MQNSRRENSAPALSGTGGSGEGEQQQNSKATARRSEFLLVLFSTKVTGDMVLMNLDWTELKKTMPVADAN